MDLHFFLDTDFDDGKTALSPEESRHAIKSLRLRAGDNLQVGDGKGNLYTAEVTDTSGGVVGLKIVDSIRESPPKFRLTLAMAPPKNRARFDWFLEKATELGADEILPLLTEHSVRPHINRNRAERVILAASKQSRRAFLPVLGEAETFESAIARAGGAKFIAHCHESMRRMGLADLIVGGVSDSAWVLIGPEGDFSPSEVESAEGAGFSGLDLGSRRLRTETAAIFATGLFKALQSRGK